MIGRIALVASVVMAPLLLTSGRAAAQDVPGIEICTVEKTMERRTSCLQSNVDFLQKTIAKLAADHQQKLDAAKAQIEGLKATVASLQKIVDELQAAAEEGGRGSEEESRRKCRRRRMRRTAAKDRRRRTRAWRRPSLAIASDSEGLSNAAGPRRS